MPRLYLAIFSWNLSCKPMPNKLTCSTFSQLCDFVAQLVRALHRHSTGHGSESRWVTWNFQVHEKIAYIVQQVRWLYVHLVSTHAHNSFSIYNLNWTLLCWWDYFKATKTGNCEELWLVHRAVCSCCDWSSNCFGFGFSAVILLRGTICPEF